MFDKLWIDMAARKAETDLPVTSHGPAGRISAAGMKTSMSDNILIFKGPARLILNSKVEGMEL